jgi:hypothetical protein
VVLVCLYQAAIYMAGNKTFLSVTEQILRRAAESNTAVLYLVETLTSNLAEVTYAAPCQLYDVPVVSYRKAIRKAVKEAERLPQNDPNVHFSKTRFSIFWPKYHTAPHPNWYVYIHIQLEPINKLMLSNFLHLLHTGSHISSLLR